MRIPVEAYEVKCDNCQAEFRADEGASFFKPDGLDDWLTNYEWYVLEDGRDYCQDCVDLFSLIVGDIAAWTW